MFATGARNSFWQPSRKTTVRPTGCFQMEGRTPLASLMPLPVPPPLPPTTNSQGGGWRLDCSPLRSQGSPLGCLGSAGLPRGGRGGGGGRRSSAPYQSHLLVAWARPSGWTTLPFSSTTSAAGPGRSAARRGRRRGPRVSFFYTLLLLFSNWVKIDQIPLSFEIHLKAHHFIGQCIQRPRITKSPYSAFAVMGVIWLSPATQGPLASGYLPSALFFRRVTFTAVWPFSCCVLYLRGSCGFANGTLAAEDVHSALFLCCVAGRRYALLDPSARPPQAEVGGAVKGRGARTAEICVHVTLLWMGLSGIVSNPADTTCVDLASRTPIIFIWFSFFKLGAQFPSFLFRFPFF